MTPTPTCLNDNAPVTLQTLLGEGGQGQVWRARVRGEDRAAKLIHSSMATPELRERLLRLALAGAPSGAFLWPEELIVGPQGSFGYLMPLREPRFRPLEDFLCRRVVPSLRALVTAAAQLADAFLKLHSRGLSYCDISFGNVFFDPRTGDVRVCDNDNVDVSGLGDVLVLGTPRFMAPEVVRGDAMPDDGTDRFSLAVLLFFLLMGGHPLDGALEARIRCMDLPAMRRLYGDEPLYIFDPVDRRNRPLKELHGNPLAFFPLYPGPLKALFELSFTQGLHRPERRVRESQWRKALLGALDRLGGCGGCGAENFLELERLGQGQVQQCWACRRALDLPLRLVIERHQVVLTPSARLRPHHLGQGMDLQRVLGEVVAHPSEAGRWGLRNDWELPWTLTRADGTSIQVGPGQKVPLVSGNRVDFGLASGGVE